MGCGGGGGMMERKRQNGVASVAEAQRRFGVN